MSNLRNILGKASDAFRNTTVVCEENKVNMLRMAAEIGSLNSHVSVISDFFQNCLLPCRNCLLCFGFKTSCYKTNETSEFDIDCSFWIMLVLHACDVVILQNIENYQSFFLKSWENKSFLWSLYY